MFYLKLGLICKYLNNIGCQLQLQATLGVICNREMVVIVLHMGCDGLRSFLFSLHRLKKHRERGREEKLKVCGNSKWRRDKSDA